MPNRVEVHHEVCKDKPGDWRLCFQWCTYVYTDRGDQQGYRFIWRRPDDTLQPARGQARIPSAQAMGDLIEMAKAEGWFERCETAHSKSSL